MNAFEERVDDEIKAALATLVGKVYAVITLARMGDHVPDVTTVDGRAEADRFASTLTPQSFALADRILNLCNDEIERMAK